MFSESAEGPMPEILTESFCERCGTRYTFESAAPPTQNKRLGKIKLLSKGLKTFVMDDDVALDEALAQARTEEERSTTSQQLDAFHDAFNFCMSCRQYTCENCWNATEGRCQTCAPLLGGDFIDEQTAGSATGRNGKAPRRPAKPSVEDLAWPTTDLRRFEGGKPTDVAPKAKPEADDKAAATRQPTPPASRPTAHPKADKAAAAAASGVVAPEAWPELPSLSDRLKKVAAPTPKTADEAPVEWPSVDTMLERPAAAAAPPVADAPTRGAPGQPRQPTPARRGGVPSSFQPGQSIDEALEAYERRRDEREVEAELARAKAARQAAARDAVAREAAAREASAREAAAREEASRQAAAREEASRQAVAREAAAREAAAREAAAREAAVRDAEDLEAAELEAAAREGLSRLAANREASEHEAPTRRLAPPTGGRDSVRRGRQPRGDDRVELPTWRVVTPDVPVVQPRQQPPAPSQPIAASHQPLLPDEPPTWPNEPQVDTLAFLANRSAAARGMEDVWAASTRDLLETAPGGVQQCVSCGLSLSATARFCRRCGTRQG